MILRRPSRPATPDPLARLEALAGCQSPPPLLLPGPSVAAAVTSPDPDDHLLPYLQGLYRLLPAEQVQYILAHTARASQRERRLPAAAVLRLVIGLGLLPQPSIPKVWRAFHPSSAGGEPSDAAFSQARHRLGVAPLRHAFDYVARPLATPATRGAFYRRWRLVAWDGTVFDVPDTPANARAFGRPGHAKGQGAFPQVRLLALCELGTHAVCAVQVKPLRCQEITMARTLVRQVQADMLLIWDRAFLDYDLVQAVRDRGAQLLARVKSTQVRQRLQELPDGSYLCALRPGNHGRRRRDHALVVRVIEYTHDDPHRPGCGEVHRLLTTILDPAELPAALAPLLYHERWEEELAFDEIKTHLNGRPVLVRSKTPAGVVQEVYGLLLAHYVIRWVMHEAAVAEGLDPDRLSFTDTVWTVRFHWPEVTAKGLSRWYAELLQEVGQQQLRPRRQRWYPRVLKKTQADYPKKRAEHEHPPQPTKPFGQAIILLGPQGATPNTGAPSG
jgi:hypothetical protein